VNSGERISSPLEPIIWQAIMMALTIGVVVFGVKRGIESASLFLLPLLGLLVIVLAIYSVSLEGSGSCSHFDFGHPFFYGHKY
jgi:NSS family neurotransmitter:Na+ symporter